MLIAYRTKQINDEYGVLIGSPEQGKAALSRKSSPEQDKTSPLWRTSISKAISSVEICPQN